ncbi:MAG: YdeI/OmpD-associated family protein [Fluviicola sp.]|nr:YdeI/OmpD-associated family protein [Fluviicola sp.]
MAKFNPAVSTYIANSAEFAQPILIELRAIIHNFCPEVVETIKWSFPNFEYKGSILCSMASFKEHCSFGFWLGSLMKDPHGIFLRTEQGGMGDLGKLKSLDDIPNPTKLGESILEAIQLIEAGVKLPKKPKKETQELSIPNALTKALAEHAAAKIVFDNFSYSHKREYVDWINGAKTEATLTKRLDTTISNLLEGKSKEWKYKK